MPDVGVTVDVRQVVRALARLEGADLRPAWRKLRRAARADQRDHAKEQEGPEGKWPPLQQRTLAARARARRKKLGGRRRRRRKPLRQRRMLGRLPTALDVRFDRRSLVIASQVKWSGAHQDGEKVGRGVRLPARTFLWWSDGFVDQARRALIDHYLDTFEGG